MEAHLFEANGLHIAFDPNAVVFYVIPTSHIEALRRLAEDDGGTGSAHDPIVEELHGLFDGPARQAATLRAEQRIGMYRKRLNRFTLILTDRCTLRCRYCYEGSECNPRKRDALRDLDPETLRKGLEFVFSQYEAIGTIMFFGGEPLLRPDLIGEACTTARRLQTEHQVHLESFGIITNGTLLTEPAVDLMKKEGIFVTLSCDGPQSLNDAWRVWPSGAGSFRWIESSAQRLARCGVPFGIQAALTPVHAELRCGTREIGSVVRPWTPVVPHVVAAQISESSPDAWREAEAAWLLSMYEEDARHCLSLIEAGRLDEMRPFTRMIAILHALIWRRGSPLRCPAGTEIALSPDGWLYPCFMFAHQESEFRLCNTWKPDSSEYWRRVDSFITANVKLKNAECSLCWARALCSGCLGASLQAHGSLDANDQLNCTITKRLAEGIMGFLAEIQSDPDRWTRFRENYTKLCTAAGPSECP